MLSDDEPRGFEKLLQSKPLPITGLDQLCEVLQNAAKEFDDNPELRLRFYEEIRKTGFAFHMAYIEKGARAAFARNPSRESLRRLTAWYADAAKGVAELYKYL